MLGDTAKSWSDDETNKLIQLVVDGVAYGDISTILARSAEACRKKSGKLGLKHPKGSRPWEGEIARAANILSWSDFRNLYQNVESSQYQEMRSSFRKQVALPNLQMTDFTKLVYRVEGDAVVAACVHVPQTDPNFWAKVLAVGDRDKISNLILAGDAVVADMFSHWPADGVSQTWSFETELESLRLHMKQALNVFEFVTVLPGNHVGNRLVRITNGHIKLSQMFTMAGLSDNERSRIQTTDLDYLELGSGDQEFLIAHSTNYSKQGGRVPTLYAEKEMRHVIAGNGHIVGLQSTMSGKYFGFEIGTIANPAFLGYANRALTNFPKMNQSFCTVRNGAVKLYGADKPLTDWEAEIGKPLTDCEAEIGNSPKRSIERTALGVPDGTRTLAPSNGKHPATSGR